jgi:hypothetical protein
MWKSSLTGSSGMVCMSLTEELTAAERLNVVTGWLTISLPLKKIE